MQVTMGCGGPSFVGLLHAHTPTRGAARLHPPVPRKVRLPCRRSSPPAPEAVHRLVRRRVCNPGPRAPEGERAKSRGPSARGPVGAMLRPVRPGLLKPEVADQLPKDLRDRRLPISLHLGHWPRAQRRLSGSANPHGMFSHAAAPPPGDTRLPLGLSTRTGEVLSPELGSGAGPRGAVVSVVPGSCCSVPESPDGCANDAFRVEGRRLLGQDVFQGPRAELRTMRPLRAPCLPPRPPPPPPRPYLYLSLKYSSKTT
ncbi:hypothetical protein NDU88_008999 [Pleurodeles waltl]|uniref:Uncharacterized protein n=1 Tax=Pleurodeles waltl TaxID=8319 RepID=A0AAV7PXU1_PLEWA|nr:hypothetical protein NDU88_008999 [Pleurodeles waltl]